MQLRATGVQPLLKERDRTAPGETFRIAVAKFGQCLGECLDRFAIFVSNWCCNDDGHAVTFRFPRNSVAVTVRCVIGGASQTFETERLLEKIFREGGGLGDGGLPTRAR
jgi:hypothetical protein